MNYMILIALFLINIRNIYSEFYFLIKSLNYMGLEHIYYSKYSLYSYYLLN